MNKEYCAPTCGFLKDDCESLPIECWRLEDKMVEPFEIKMKDFRGIKTYIVVGENNVFYPQWILSDGSRVHKQAPWIIK